MNKQLKEYQDKINEMKNQSEEKSKMEKEKNELQLRLKLKIEKLESEKNIFLFHSNRTGKININKKQDIIIHKNNLKTSSRKKAKLSKNGII